MLQLEGHLKEKENNARLFSLIYSQIQNLCLVLYQDFWRVIWTKKAYTTGGMLWE